MFCKFCGKQIQDDSVFCSICGKKIATNDTENQTKEPINKNSTPTIEDEKTNETKKSSPWGLFLFFPIIIFIFIAIIAVASQNDCNLGAKTLTSSDYTYTTSQGLSSYSITLSPEKDIKICEITLTLYNSSKDIIYSDTISKSNLKKGAHYTYTFNFDLESALHGKNVKYYITGKL